MSLQSLRGLRVSQAATSSRAPSSSNARGIGTRPSSWCALNAGKSAMDAIRALIGERVLIEQRNVDRLMALERDARDATLRSSISVSVLAVLLMIVLAYVVRRDSARLRLDEEAAGDDHARHRRCRDRHGPSRDWSR